ncbi:MAG: hypothetical protein GWO19_09395, partial [Nitrospinaceae bacterium]|nr:hypothetical protein [Nitrospinaceae bacterium]NIS85216.1 hypothetical protein [Nitrospinaceae bacterium]NIU96420.1 hypothetical protein [Nitrospinaceae bacterium]NIW59055.1 hypothetical protein [Nitrospinaceae bacterium]
LMKMNLWPENVVVSLPRHHYSFQSFELPAPDRKAVDSMVEFEMERHFSFGLEGLLYGWHVSSKGEKNYHIISAALKKETAEEYLDLVRRLGIPTTILDVPTFADANLILWNDKTCRSLEAIVDLGTQALEIILVKNRSVEFSCNLPLNDPDFKNAYLRDDLSPDYHESMAIGMAKLIVEELQEALASCRNIDDSEAVERIHFLGGGPYAPYVARQLEKETEVVTLLVPIPEPVSSPPPETYSTAFMATSLGLAMRDMKPAEIEVN